MFNYFKDRNYIAFHLNNIGTKFASTLVLSFTGAYFYSSGLSLTLILVYFALEFGFRGLFSPLAGIVSSRIGLRKTIILSYLFLILYFISLGFIESYFLLGYFGFIFHSISRGLYYPIKHTAQSLFIEEGNRGKFLTFEIVLSTIIGVIAISLASFVVSEFQTFFPIIIVASVFLIISSLSIFFLLDEPKRTHKKISYIEVLNFLRTQYFRSDALAFAGFSASIVVNNVIVSLLIFSLSKDLTSFAIMMNLVLIFELIFTLLFGHYIDKKNSSAFSVGSISQIYSYLLCVLAPKTFLGIFVMQAFYKISWNMFDSSATSIFHSKIKLTGNSVTYSCCKEMILGLCACIILLFLALLSLYIQESVFIVAFGVGTAGIYILKKYL